jgi:hypothetical protein
MSDFKQQDDFAYFDLCVEGYQRTLSNVTEVRKYIKVGSYTVLLNFAGDSLVVALTDSLSHLFVPATDTPDLTINIWDRHSTSIELPPLLKHHIQLITINWSQMLGARKEVLGVDGPNINAHFHIGPNILSVFKKSNNQACYFIDSADCLPFWEKGSPFQAIMSWWTAKQSMSLLHAAAVGTQDGGVLIVGKGGTGKSTCALACLNSDLSYLGDDYCLVEKITPSAGYFAHSLYNSGKLKGSADFRRFPWLEACQDNPDRLGSEKAIFFFQKHLPSKLVTHFPVKAILIPKISHIEQTRYFPISPAAGMIALAPSSMLQLPGESQKMLTAIRNLVQDLPCVSIEIGSDVTQIPLAIKDILTEVKTAQRNANQLLSSDS